MRYGLLGWPLERSHSERIHRLLGNQNYGLYPVKEEELQGFLAQPDLGGLNVTIPYKQAVIPYCRELSERARQIGAVNTLVYTDRGILGHNTDCDGLLYMARRAGISLEGQKVVILGSGGTSLTAAWVARKMGAAEVVRISRRGQDNYQNIERHGNAQVLINTTPVGMAPNSDAAPVDLSRFRRLAGVLDVVYDPLKTALILQAEAAGIPCSGGLPMLVEQAVTADRLFFGRSKDSSVTEELLNLLQKETENLVLMGMPGCGKTTLGSLAAKMLGRPFLDLDQEIQTREGKTPEQIILEEGEEAFRRVETAVVKSIGHRTGMVMACGGGTPLRKENLVALRQNGRILYLRRDLEKLPVEGRPLSGDLPKLYQERRPIYEAAADMILENDGTPEEVAEKMVAWWNSPPAGKIQEERA